MNRLDRLSAILIQLQGKRLVQAREIAERFDISLRTVYRDIRSLEAAGVPIVSEAGLGYSLAKGYRMPPVHLTRKEAVALLLGEKLAERFADAPTRRHYGEAMHKIRAVLAGEEQDHLEALEKGITWSPFGKYPESEAENTYFAELQDALARGRVIRIAYQAPDREPSERLVEPLGLCHYSSRWHLIGWCRLRQDYRDFRLDRITSLEALREGFNPQDKLTLREYLDRMERNNAVTRIRVRFHKDAVNIARNQRLYFGFVEEEADETGVTMTFLFDQLESIGRWLLSYTYYVVIEEPPELIESMRRLLGELEGRYRGVEAMGKPGSYHTTSTSG